MKMRIFSLSILTVLTSSLSWAATNPLVQQYRSEFQVSQPAHVADLKLGQIWLCTSVYDGSDPLAHTFQTRFDLENELIKITVAVDLSVGNHSTQYMSPAGASPEFGLILDSDSETHAYFRTRNNRLLLEIVTEKNETPDTEPSIVRPDYFEYAYTNCSLLPGHK